MTGPLYDTFILRKDHLPGFLRKLRKESRLVAPLRNRLGDTMFAEVRDLDNCSLDLEAQPQNSVKQFLFPQQEVLFTYTTGAGQYEFTPAPRANPPTVYFGVHSCDLSAILYMDVVFSQHARDPLYLTKRQESVLIGLNCNEPFANCFCNATGSGPFLEIGADLQLTDLGDRYYVEVGRATGDAIVRRFRQFFSPAEEKDTKIQYQRFLEARGLFKRQVYVDQAVKRLAAGAVDQRIWERLSHRCQDCGGCAYVCPTCICHTITDCRVSATAGERLRSWDACTFSGFTRMAGGHNPVTRRNGAIKQRFMHKLHYDVQRHGRPSCVGCGRCVGMCFGGTDIVRFIDLVSEQE